MAKEIIYPSQFARVEIPVDETELQASPEQQQELRDLYDQALKGLATGSIISGKVVKNDASGVVIDISYKSNGIIPRYEFSEHELKNLQLNDTIEVMLEDLEDSDGHVLVSYEKAKATKAWDAVMKLYDENKPVEGLVTHKVKGGLNVDIGIPAFLPGSQIDIQRVTNFDQYVGQKVTANVIKINKKRGNVIISRRKFLNDQRSELRKDILDSLQVDQVIQGIVKNITNYGAFIDIGGVDGLLHITDMTWGRISHPSELVKIGDTVTVKVLSFDKQNEKISLGLKQLEDNPWEKVYDQLSVGAVISGTISSIADYGLFIEIAKGVEGLVHISEVSWTDRITNLADKFKVGDPIKVLVVSLDKENRRMSLSIKQLQKNPWEAIGEQFKVGQTIEGTVSNITDFGVFVQLIPGVDGLVHISDLSWTEHISHPSDIYKRGQAVKAVILNIDEKSKKISLGIKQLNQDPWENIEKEYPVASIIEGEVAKITNFGAFIKLPIGIEGLVHISELAADNVQNVEDILKVGEKKKFRVINVSKEERKLGLSLKLEGPIETEKPKAAPRAAQQQHQQQHQQQQQQQQRRAPRASQQESSEQQHQSQYQSSSSQQQTASSGSKQKSAFQMALEQHAARKNEDNKD